jgi:hypothetical protein
MIPIKRSESLGGIMIRWQRKVSPFVWVGAASALATLGFSTQAQASSGGISSGSFTNINLGCNNCHSGGTAPAVMFGGPSTVNPGSTTTFTFTVNSGSAAKGFNVRANGGTITKVGGDGATKELSGEITHASPQAGSNIVFSFRWTAPGQSPGLPTNFTFTGWGNAVNNTGSTGGDLAASATKVVTVRNCNQDNDPAWASGVCGGNDCADNDPARYPGNPEVCDNKDNNCNGSTDEGLALSTCGVGECANVGSTCFSNSCTPKASSAEVCDGKDNNCNGVNDDGLGTTTCGVGACFTSVSNCSGGTGQTCTPLAPTTETCSNVGNGSQFDNDCDGDSTELEDGIHDGDVCMTGELGVCAIGKYHCLGNTLTCVRDIDPSAEICDNLDNDCNGTVDDGLPFATCGLGVCFTTGTSCFASSCTPLPKQIEVCDGLDNDCDGTPDNGFPLATCGVGACTTTGSSCFPSSCTPGTPSAETCNGIDDNCDGKIDENCDKDGDDYCDAALTLTTSPECPKGGGDCDDNDATVFPTAPELCDGKDNDCNGNNDDNVQNPTCGTGACTAPAQACMNGVPQGCTPLDPMPEICDGIDNDCNGIIDEGVPQQQCGQGQCVAVAPGCLNGSVPTCTPGTPGVEMCDGLDNDCDGVVDNGTLCATADEVCLNGQCVVDPDAGSPDAGQPDAQPDAEPMDAGADVELDTGTTQPANVNPAVLDEGLPGGGGGCVMTVPVDRMSTSWLLVLLAGMIRRIRRRKLEALSTKRHQPLNDSKQGLMSVR